MNKPIPASQFRERAFSRMSEAQFQTDVVGLARGLGFDLVYHTYDSRRSEPGFPDLILVHSRRGVVLFRELKAEKGRVSVAQSRWLEGLGAAGVDAGVWRPSDLASGRIVRELQGKGVAGA